MIISRKHRYLFIENPLTASWTIHKELCAYYAGTPILDKHSSYPEFLRTATAEERDYFVFATVRNPLDKIVSGYFKLKTDHKSAFSDPEAVTALKIDYVDRTKFEFVADDGAGFADFFRRFYTRPYGDMLDLSDKYLDFVIRYEHLQDDFSDVLRRLNIQQVRPLPVRNKTRAKKAEWQTYYTPELRKQAQQVCGPYMKKWGYDFPSEWGEYRVSRIDIAQYRVFALLRNVYLTYLRYNDRAYARFIRKLRARVMH